MSSSSFVVYRARRILTMNPARPGTLVAIGLRGQLDGAAIGRALLATA